MALNQQISAIDAETLSAEQIAAGWHFCPDWDLMIVNINDIEGEGSCCNCSFNQSILKYIEPMKELKT